MKILHFIALYVLVFSVTSCQKDEDTNTAHIDGSWHLVNVSGGFAGIDKEYNKGVIVWKFSTENNILTVANSLDSDGNYSGLASGTYSFSIIMKDSNSYLVVDNNEIGGMTLANNELILDQNQRSLGSGADLYVLKLSK